MGKHLYSSSQDPSSPPWTTHNLLQLQLQKDLSALASAGTCTHMQVRTMEHSLRVTEAEMAGHRWDGRGARAEVKVEEVSPWQQVRRGWEPRKGTGCWEIQTTGSAIALQHQLGAVAGEAAHERDGEGQLHPGKPKQGWGWE